MIDWFSKKKMDHWYASRPFERGGEIGKYKPKTRRPQIFASMLKCSTKPLNL
jgi:hypothetical protein